VTINQSSGVDVSRILRALALAKRRLEEPLQVSVFNPVEDVDVLGEYGRALKGCRDTTDDDELDLLKEPRFGSVLLRTGQSASTRPEHGCFELSSCQNAASKAAACCTGAPTQARASGIRNFAVAHRAGWR
jgi:hypothetical protein